MNDPAWIVPRHLLRPDAGRTGWAFLALIFGSILPLIFAVYLLVLLSSHSLEDSGPTQHVIAVVTAILALTLGSWIFTRPRTRILFWAFTIALGAGALLASAYVVLFCALVWMGFRDSSAAFDSSWLGLTSLLIGLPTLTALIFTIEALRAWAMLKACEAAGVEELQDVLGPN